LYSDARDSRHPEVERGGDYLRVHRRADCEHPAAPGVLAGRRDPPHRARGAAHPGQNLRAGGYALGWLQCEDYGAVTPHRLWATRGQTARVEWRADH
jgi:hypothetical protein